MSNLVRLRDSAVEICRNDSWQPLCGLPNALPPRPLLLFLATWLERHGKAGVTAPWLALDDEVEALLLRFVELLLIAVDLSNLRDGRGYSLVYLLRVCLGWSDELRVVGDVLHDQLSHVCQCSFDAFTVCGDRNVEDALKGLAGLNALHDRSAIEP